MKRLWRALIRLIRRLLGRPQDPPQPAPVTVAPEPDDAQCEQIFMELLEGVAQGWTKGRCKGFLMSKNMKAATLGAWLRRFGQRLLQSPEQHQELGRRLQQLGDLGLAELSPVAAELTRELVEEEEVDPGVQVIEAEFLGDGLQVDETGENDEVEVWCDRGNTQLFQGNFFGAVASYDRALEIKPDYHEAWYNRGLVLNNLGKSEEAIASYNRALEIKPDYYEAWTNRGLVLDNLGKLEEALASYNRALEIESDKHEVWNGLGNALKHLGMLEEALASYDRALEIKPDFHKAWLNRGNSAGKSTQANLSLSSNLTIQYPQLNQRGFGGELASYNQGLEFCPQETHPEGWGMLQREIGRSHYNRGRTSLSARDAGRSDFREALERYHLALQTLTREAFPELHLQLIQDLLKVNGALHRYDEVKEWEDEGFKVYNELISGKSPRHKRQLQIQYIRFARMQVDWFLERNQLVEAMESAEYHKNLYLTWMLDNLTHPEEEIVSPSYDTIQQRLLNQSTALIHWHLTDSALTTFILLPGSTAPLHFTSNPQPLYDWIAAWNYYYQQHREPDKNTDSQWRATLNDELNQLQQLLEIDRLLNILAEHTTPLEHLILVPHLDLHRFPLHIFFPDNFTTRYLPSAQVGIALSEQPPTPESSLSLLCIDAPDSVGSNNKSLQPLPHANMESEYVCGCVPNSRCLSDNEATLGALTTELRNDYRIFHFTGHGSTDLENPKHSALFLSQTDRLQVQQLSKIDLSHYDLACLSACETGATDKGDRDNDYVGINSAFLAQGVSRVIATLWTVESSASAWFMMRFYQQRRKDSTIPDTIHFHNTRNWLQTLTNRELCEWYEELLQEPGIEGTIQQIVGTELCRLRSQLSEIGEERPYEDPYYWAAFTLSGAA